MDLGKVTNPIVIRQQFLFQRFIMLKMFLGAAAGSALFLAVLSVTSPQRFGIARQGFIDSMENKGLTAVIVGPMLLGAGMALSGACPGMVLVQCGSGVASGPVTLAGGFFAAAVFGVVQPYLAPWMASCNMKKGGLEDVAMFSKMPFWQLATALFMVCSAVVGVIEYFFPWSVSNNQWSQWAWKGELPSFTTPWKDALPPSLMGLCVGALQVPCVLWCLDTLGSSTAYMTYTSQLLLTKNVQDKMRHWNGFRLGLANWWQAVYLVFAIFGAYISSQATQTFGKAEAVKEWQAFVGGFIMIFGSRIASGCTSGHGLSGMGLLIVKSILAVPAMFLGGIIVAFAYQAVDPAGYTGFAFPEDAAFKS